MYQMIGMTAEIRWSFFFLAGRTYLVKTYTECLIGYINQNAEFQLTIKLTDGKLDNILELIQN